MFTFSASGDTTPPMIIYPHNLNLVPEECENGWMKSEIFFIGLNENGWMKAEIFFEYISKVLNPYLYFKENKATDQYTIEENKNKNTTYKYFKENKATDQYTIEENKNKNTTILNWEDIPIGTYQELLLDSSVNAQQKNANGSLSDGILSDSLIQEKEVEEIKYLNDNNQEQMALAGAYHKDLEKTEDRRIYEGGDMELTETFLDWPETIGEFMKGEIWN
ncbi:hypothetical protein QE152_g25153 [Popillia japonica]|uniref:Uncharacterized protein n=1 Tax=Popillia japonica TaxID=7064 RepID=A0AAW1K2E5_POPJA